MSDVVGKCVGIEVGKTSMTAVCVDESGAITGVQTAEVSFAEPSSSQLIYFISSLKSSFGDFQRVGVAVPGLVDRGARKVAFSSHIPEHSGMDLGSEIEMAAGVQAYIENDANAAAYAEYRLGAGRGSENMFYATLGLGVGGSFIFGGEIWRGAAGFAGEFGYVPIDEEGTRLEEVASSPNIIRRTRSRFHQDSTSSLVDLDENSITIADIVAAANAEDDFSKLMLERTGHYVGTGIAAVINLLNIERIVIGGDIMQAKHLVLDAVIDRAKELSFAPSFGSTTIVEGELGANAAAAGAALLACQG
ncbi:MAG: ROK family protein [Pyrinomonadaceae bacterium]|nr:ROK family protein [Acidobacteriota bacterium]MBP7377567.1 ROK family protein [Pyrinomonadaceae bacterium]